MSVIGSSQAQTVKPQWVGNRPYRILLEVKPSEMGSRSIDERPAKVSIDFEQLLRKQLIPRRADLSTLQIVRYAKDTGSPIEYKNNLYRDTPYDLPLQWYALEANIARSRLWNHKF